MSDDNSDAYREKMARRKTHMDKRIENADESRGVAIVLTGNGKGKSSSAFGMVARAVGHGMRSAIVYFIKSRKTGEQLLFERLPEVEIHLMGEGFTWDTQDRERDRAAADRGWQECARILQDPDIDLVVLDELNVALSHGMLSLGPVVEAVRTRPANQHVVITGRNAPEELIELADTVSDVKVVKHAFKKGIKAQNGLEL